jgi:broad specificity phosphatase PhoE
MGDDAAMGELVIIRHGQTEWSATGRHTSYTEMDLTPEGVAQAKLIAAALAGWRFATVLTSPRLRARRTAELAGLTPFTIDDGLTEWNYGQYEGATTTEIRAANPGWSLWRDGCPAGESPTGITVRTDALLERLGPLLAGGDVALVGHGHTFRVIAARWLGQPVAAGAGYALDTASISVLGHEREQRVMRHWNLPSGAPVPRE